MVRHFASKVNGSASGRGVQMRWSKTKEPSRGVDVGGIDFVLTINLVEVVDPSVRGGPTFMGVGA